MGLSLGFLSERDIKGTIPFTITTKRIKYLWLHLPKETEDLYAENYKTLTKEIKDDVDGEVYYALALETILWK